MAGAKQVSDGPIVEILSKHKLPKVYRVRQRLDQEQITDLESVFQREAMRPGCFDRVLPGMKIAVAAGSRGIDRYARVLALAVKEIRRRGAEAFIFPAMGSHGGATAEGQRSILRHYGIEEDTMGCPIVSSMETVVTGRTQGGLPVYMDASAFGADGVIVVNRVKAHTAIRGPLESGLVKMCAIGLGKQIGADTYHERGLDRLAQNIREAAEVNLASGKILFGIALVENASDRMKLLKAIPAERFLEEEPALLEEAKRSMPRIWLDECDVLVVDQVGKNISGSGMDPNVSGTHHICGPAFGGIRSKRRAVLDLTDETEGNGTGLGMADITTQRAYEKFDFNMSYANPLTCGITEGVRIPIVLPNDRLAIQGAIQACTGVDHAAMRIIRIRNTLDLSVIEVSEALLPELEKHPERFEILEGPYAWSFDEKGNLF